MLANNITAVRLHVQRNEERGVLTFSSLPGGHEAVTDVSLTFPHNSLGHDAREDTLLRSLLNHDWHDSLTMAQEGFCLVGAKVVPNMLYVFSAQIDITWYGTIDTSPGCSFKLTSPTSDWQYTIPERITKRLNTIDCRFYVPRDVEVVNLEVTVNHATEHVRAMFELNVPTQALRLTPIPNTHGLQRCIRSNTSHNHKMKNNLSTIVDHIYVLHNHATMVSQTYWMQEELYELFGVVPQVLYSTTSTKQLEAQGVHSASTCEACWYLDAQWLSLASDKYRAVPTPINKSQMTKERREQLIDALTHALTNRTQRVMIVSSDVAVSKHAALQLQTLYNHWPSAWNMVLLGAYEHLPTAASISATQPGATTIVHASQSVPTTLTAARANGALALDHVMPLKPESHHGSHFAMMLNGSQIQQELLRYLQQCSQQNANPFPKLFKAPSELVGFVVYPNLFVPHETSAFHRQYQREQPNGSIANLIPSHPFYWSAHQYAHSSESVSGTPQRIDSANVNVLSKFQLRPSKMIHVVLVWDTTKRPLDALQNVIRNMNAQTYNNWQLHIFSPQPDGVTKTLRDTVKAQSVWMHMLSLESTSWSARLLSWLDQISARDLVTFWDPDCLMIPDKLNLQCSWWLSQPEPPSVHMSSLPSTAISQTSRSRLMLESQETFIATYGVDKPSKRCKIASAHHLTLMASASAFRTELMRYQQVNGMKLTMRVLGISALRRTLEQLFQQLSNVYSVQFITQAVSPEVLAAVQANATA